MDKDNVTKVTVKDLTSKCIMEIEVNGEDTDTLEQVFEVIEQGDCYSNDNSYANKNT